MQQQVREGDLYERSELKGPKRARGTNEKESNKTSRRKGSNNYNRTVQVLRNVEKRRVQVCE